MNTNKMVEEWEKFDKIMEDVFGDTGLETSPHIIKESVLSLLSLQKEEILEEYKKNPPYMDVSSWKNYGEKMGFDKFFGEKQKIRTLEKVEEVRKKLSIRNAVLKSYLTDCLDRNGLPYCKNCGLSEEDLLDEELAKLTSLKQDSGEIKK